MRGKAEISGRVVWRQERRKGGVIRKDGKKWVARKEAMMLR